MSLKNLVFFFAVFELLSIIPPLFVLVGSRRLSLFVHEVAIRYAAYNIVVTICMLFGVVLFYVLTGSLNLFVIATSLVMETNSVRLFVFAVSTFLFFSPFFFKLGLAPFHWLVADIYRALPMNYLIVYSTFFKLGVLIVFIQLFATCFWALASLLSFFFFSIFLGTFCVVSSQVFFLTNLRALWGYLSSLTVALFFLPFLGGCDVTAGFIVGEGIFFLSGFVVYCLGLVVFFYTIGLVGYYSRKPITDLADLSVIAGHDSFLFFFFRIYFIIILFLIVGLPPSYLF